MLLACVGRFEAAVAVRHEARLNEWIKIAGRLPDELVESGDLESARLFELRDAFRKS